uniref:Uncharacterized protein n=1 Tax=Oryza rufipogon TaxID=4529 RepID=A0A0E0QF82_ORYRU
MSGSATSAALRFANCGSQASTRPPPPPSKSPSYINPSVPDIFIELCIVQHPDYPQHCLLLAGKGPPCLVVIATEFPLSIAPDGTADSGPPCLVVIATEFPLSIAPDGTANSSTNLIRAPVATDPMSSLCLVPRCFY